MVNAAVMWAGGEWRLNDGTPTLGCMSIDFYESMSGPFDSSWCRSWTASETASAADSGDLPW